MQKKKEEERIKNKSWQFNNEEQTLIIKKLHHCSEHITTNSLSTKTHLKEFQRYGWTVNLYIIYI